LKILEIRENSKLFNHMSHLYNLIVKKSYLLSFEFREPLISKRIEHIKSFNNGRIDGLRPSKIK